MLRPTIIALVSITTLGACAASRPLEAPLPSAPYMQPPEEPPVLTQNHFKRDIMGDVDEAQLRDILASPVFLEEKSRIGILPVTGGYDVDSDIPVGVVPGALQNALAESGQFEVVSEVTTDWPHASGTIGGLRELAARYRAEYLLLTRDRWVSRSHANGWAVGWLTIVGGLVLPHRTIEVAGVIEATLLDVKTGTLLFTTYERAYAKSLENVWQNDRKRIDMKLALVKKAMKSLNGKVLDQITRLVAARPPRRDLRPAAVVPAPIEQPAPTGAALASDPSGAR